MKLRQQEKTVLFVVIAIVVMLFVVFKVIVPSGKKSRFLDKKISQREMELREIRELQARYNDLFILDKDIQAILGKREKNFFSPTLWARLADKAEIPKENFKQEIKQPSYTGDVYRDMSAHLELEGVTLEQLTKFISGIESADPFFKLKNLYIRRIEKVSGLIKVSFDVVTQIK